MLNIVKSFTIVVFTIVTGLLVAGGTVAAQGVYQSGTTGVDISFPNCSAAIPKAAFGVVGVTHGLAYSYNDCLSAQARQFSNLSLYINTGWYDQSAHINPTSPLVCVAGDSNCLAYNYGYNAAVDAANYAKAQGVWSSMWWLDVETENSWNANVIQNQNSLLGARKALLDNGAGTVGAYSTTAQWQTITGGWKNGWPNWGASTWNTAKQAAKYCKGHEFTGGPTYLIQ